MTSPSPLAKKLGVKPGNRVLVVGAPDGFALDPLPEGATVTSAVDGRVPVVLAFVRDSAAVEVTVPVAAAAVADRGLLWFAYPKGGKKAGTDLGRDVLHRQMGTHGLVGVTLVAVDDTWSAMRFRPESEVGT